MEALSSEYSGRLDGLSTEELEELGGAIEAILSARTARQQDPLLDPEALSYDDTLV